MRTLPSEVFIKEQFTREVLAASREIKLEGLARRPNDHAERIAFSLGETCKTWLYIPTRLISKIDFYGTTVCHGATHNKVAIYIKSGSASTLDLLTELLSTPGDEHGRGETRSMPITTVKAKEPGYLLERRWISGPHLRVDAPAKPPYHKNYRQTGLYTPPRGMFVLQIKTSVITSAYGWHSVEVVGGGANFVTQSELKHVYDEAIKVASEMNNAALGAELQNKYEQHLQELYKTQSAMNDVRAVVTAYAHGWPPHRGLHEIQVDVEVVRVGATGGDVAAGLEAQYAIDIPNV